jgi:uncharacterized Ntn-hydrolase superfamily protein
MPHSTIAFQSMRSVITTCQSIRSFFLLGFLASSPGLFSQNLPSLITGRNINATFSIVGYDAGAREWGVAVATNNIYVGNSTVYIQPGLGAFSVIAETEPAYAINGFEQLRSGKSIREAIGYTMKNDSDAYLRQVSGIDSLGNCFAFTGSAWKYQKGYAGHFIGKGYVVMGNQLADSVLLRMSSTFEKTAGTLAQRLLAALIAGERAGGQVTGKQSAALAVKGANNEWFNNIDLRVDNSRDPFGDLQILLNYHYGRIRLNQAIGAIRMGNIQKGKDLLADAARMVKGWNGLQGKIALAYLLLHEEAQAVSVIRAAISDNPQWKENLPAFYLLRNDPGMKGLIDENKFGEKDWIAAVSLLDQLDRNAEMGSLAKKALQRFPSSSYLSFQLGEALLAEGRRDEAKLALQEAIRLDPANEEAVRALEQATR